VGSHKIFVGSTFVDMSSHYTCICLVRIRA